MVRIVGDVGTRDSASAILASAVTATGGTLDCLFNCVGLLEMGPHYSIPPERVDHMLAVNVNGVVNCIDAALPTLRAKSSAHIVILTVWLSMSPQSYTASRFTAAHVVCSKDSCCLQAPPRFAE